MANPNWSYGYVPTAGELNALFASKQDVLNYVPLNSAGGPMSGRLITAASTSSISGFNIQPGVTPASLLNGDMWVTSAGLFVQINGGIVGPLLGATGSAGLTFTANATGYSIAGGLITTKTLAVTNTLTLAGTDGTTVIAPPSGNLVGTTDSQTLTNKTLTAPAITGGGLNVSGRLTLTSGAPVMTANVAAAGTVIWTPYNGNMVPLWNGTQFVWTPCAELSNILANASVGNAGPSAAVASQVYDLYIWNNAGVPTLTRSPTWASGGGSNTVRGSGANSAALTRVNGILTNTNAITNGPAAQTGTYVGTVATDGSGATVTWNTGGSGTGGVAAVLNVWNTYNRVSVGASVVDTGAAYTYTSGTIRQARASTGNQISFVMGLIEDAITSDNLCTSQTVAVINSNCNTGIGLDSITAYGSPRAIGQTPANFALFVYTASPLTIGPLQGAHYISALESGDTTNANTFNALSTNILQASLRM